MTEESCCKNNKLTQRLKKFDRKNFCLYCHNLVTNFSRHILRRHALEKEVLEYMSIRDENLKERIRKRRLITDDLRQRGNFLYNSSGTTDFLPYRRNKNPEKSYNTLDYSTCRFCLGMFTRKTFYLHVRKCNKKHPENKETLSEECNGSDITSNKIRKQSFLKSDGIQIIHNLDGASTLLQSKILPILQKDEVGLIALNDPLILSMGSQFLNSHQEQKDVYNVTKKLRDAAKILKICMKNPGIKKMEDCLKPKNSELLMQAVQELCGLDSETGVVTVVGMAPRLSYIIQECAKLLLCNTITNFNLSSASKEAIKTEINDFLHLFKSKWKYVISTNTEKTRKKKQTTKPRVMPQDEDIKLIAKKIKELENIYYAQLLSDPTPENYENLCKITIAHIIILNRRRSGEVARAELEYFLNRPPNDELTEDVLETLNEEEKNSLNELTVFMVPGKLVHTVPILLTKTMKKSIDLLVATRSAVKVKSTNKLLFARVYTDNPFDGSKVIRELRQQCELKKIAHMTATGLRHHVATKSQIHGDDRYTENICTFLGHTKNIHIQNYRLPLQAIQRGQIGHRLLEMEGTYSSKEKATVNKPSFTITTSVPEETTVYEDIHHRNGCSLTLPNTTITSSSVKTASYETLQNSTGIPIIQDDSDLEENELLSESTYFKPKIVRKRWSKLEKTVVLQHFSEFIKHKKNPGMKKCCELIQGQPCLAGRTWQQLNTLVNNFIKGKIKLPLEFVHLQ